MTKEFLQKLRAAKSAEELKNIAKANGKELTYEEAKAAFDGLCGTGELTDDDLEKVAGGLEEQEWYIRLSKDF